MIKQMQKLRIIGPKQILPRVIQTLHDQKVLHLVETKDEQAGESFANAEKLSEALVKLDAISSKIFPSKKQIMPKKSASQVVSLVESLAQQMSKLEQSNAQADVGKRKESLDKAQLLHELGVGDLAEFSSLETFVGSVDDASLIDEQIKKITSRCWLKTLQEEKEHYIALCIEKKQAQKAEQILSKHAFSKLEYLNIPSLAEARKQYEDAQTQVRENEHELKKIEQDHAQYLEGYETLLNAELMKAQFPLQCRQTQKTFIVYGFVPKEEEEKLQKELSAFTSLAIEKLSESNNQIIPIQLKNPKHASGFEFFLHLLSLPSYKEIDPTLMLSITFPIFFGFMLGDMGYGVVAALLFLALKKFYPQFKGFFNILLLSSLSSIVFGAIFAEAFGLEFYHPLINRNPHHDITLLMIAPIVLGILHVNLALILGFVNEHRSHGFKTAFFEKAGWMILQVGVALLALSYLQIILLLPLVGYIVIALAILIIYKGEGIAGLAELPSIFGNILSYARLMAIALSSVGIALVVNELASPFLGKGVFPTIAGISILLVGHVLNIGVGCLGSFLHSLRLHYVESFGKFYKGGGVAYKPFGGA